MSAVTVAGVRFTYLPDSTSRSKAWVAFDVADEFRVVGYVIWRTALTKREAAKLCAKRFNRPWAAVQAVRVTPIPRGTP